MIRPPEFRGAAFGAAADGDARKSLAARHSIAEALDIPDAWAWVNQVHGNDVVRAERAGLVGSADALFATHPGIPLMVATADCVPVIIEAPDAVAVVHAGWRGTVAGVVAGTIAVLQREGHRPDRAAIGPAIGPCCYEVGSDVADRLHDFRSTTRAGTRSVDLPRAVAAQLVGLEVWQSGLCTHHDVDFHSYRRNATSQRQVAVAWMPQ
jgi:YfiH family protein